MKNQRPITTLFMLSSLDGKISTGDTDKMDVDSDYRKIVGLKEGLAQYYDIEKTTDAHFLITGRVMTKNCESLNINKCKVEPQKVPANCIIIDNNHLTKSGVEYLLKKFITLCVVTTNALHPVFKLRENVDNLTIIHYSKKIDFADLFIRLKSDYGIKRLTIQSGGTMNAELLRGGLIDHISLVVAPCLIGGKNTASLIDGESLHTQKELNKIKALKLKECKVLKNSYLHLQYVVNN